MQGFSDAQRVALTAAVERLAWTAVRDMLDLDSDAGPESDLPDADLRQMWLAALGALLAIQESADELAASAALSAAQRGADYPAIGEAAGMTRQGARRKWPGLAEPVDARRRKVMWWNSHGGRFAECARAVLTLTEGQESPWSANLRTRLAELEERSPAHRMDVFDMVLVDAHAVALRAPTPAEPAAARAVGLLAALTADAFAATNTYSSLDLRDDITCGARDCPFDPIVDLLLPDIGHHAVPTCRRHAVEALRRPANRIVTAYQPDVAPSLLAEVHGE